MCAMVKAQRREVIFPAVWAPDIRLECQDPYLVRAISRAVDHSFLTLALGSIL